MTPFHFTLAVDAVSDFERRLQRRRIGPMGHDAHGALGLSPERFERLATGFEAFDWRAFTDRLNRHPAYMYESGGEFLHFTHCRSAEPDALPILLLHGWPGSYLEFAELITHLSTGDQPFHVVCPSLPGFGFSTRSLDASVCAGEMAGRVVDLMVSLGYRKFIVHGGDWGSVVASEVARQFPELCLGLHLNFVPIQPPPESHSVFMEISEAERGWLAHNQRVMADGMGYYAIQSTRPQTLAVALNDSPAGLLAWIGEKFVAWSGRDAQGQSLVSDLSILDHVALYWLTQTIGSSIRLYYDEAAIPSVQSRVEVPTGVAVFPHEIVRLPRSWVSYRYNVIHWTIHRLGGHFAALEVPSMLARDLRNFAKAAMELHHAGP